MPFEPGKIPEGATPFKPGEVHNPEGRPVGTKNRSTIARKVLEMKYLFTEDRFDKLKAVYPEIEKSMTVEEVMTIVMAAKSVEDSDDKAYRAIMDSAYGAPKQEIDNNLTGQINIINLGSGIPPLDETTTETGECDLLSEG